MKTKTALLLSSLSASAFILTGCACKHEMWNDASCTAPKTCAECGVTEGEPLGHDWLEADCENPKTCKVCGETEGEPLEHKWKEATCEKPKTCELCGETEGEKMEHTTDRGKCSNCGEYVFDNAFIPDYDDFTSCLGFDMIPSEFTYAGMNETNSGFDVRLSIPDNKRMDCCEDLGWDVMLGYTGTSDYNILTGFIMSYVPENQDDLNELYSALKNELETRLGKSNSGSDTWSDSTGTLDLSIYKVANAVTINIQMR